MYSLCNLSNHLHLIPHAERWRINDATPSIGAFALPLLPFVRVVLARCRRRRRRLRLEWFVDLSIIDLWISGVNKPLSFFYFFFFFFFFFFSCPTFVC